MKIAAQIEEAATLERLGDLAGAMARYRKVLKREPSNIEALFRLGRACCQQGDLEAGGDMFRRIVKLRPRHAPAHTLLGRVMAQSGHPREAIPCYDRALAADPGFAMALINKADALVALGHDAEAVANFERAIPLMPGLAELHVNLAHALQRLERYPEALASYDKALAIDPTHAPAASHKGAMLYMLGRLDEARAQLARAIALAPDNTANYRLLSEMKRFAPGDTDVAAMEKLLPGLDARPPRDQINLQFALAKAYDDIGDRARAFANLTQGNALKRREVDYDENAVHESYERIAQVFTPALMIEKAGRGDPSERPVFVIGMPRSGTTLIEQILASHPRVYGAGERSDFGKAVAAADKVLGATYPEGAAALTPETLQTIAAHYLAGMVAAVRDADRFVDKMPANYVYAGLIHLALPKARIVHVRRDPVDTCLSCFATHFRTSQAFSYDLGELGRYYRAYETLMAHWRNVLPPDTMLEVEYEDVVADLEGQARRLLDFCGLDWNDACLAFHKTARPVRTASAAQVRQPIYKNSVGRWRAYEDELRPLIAALGVER